MSQIRWPFTSRPYQWHPLFYHLSVWQKRAFRYAEWHYSGRRFASARAFEKLEHRVFKHTSKLIRRIDDHLMYLQHNKVQNLRIAIRELDGTLIRPGETFSFCKLVGPPLRVRGFVEGIELSRGVARPGIGGGLCQLSNLLHWLVLHSPLEIVERHHHGFDPFPDDGRILPFGSGATVFYNYRDYQFRNTSDATFQVRFWLTEKLLEGELRSDRRCRHAYRVFEQNHRYVRRDGKIYRANEIWREIRLREDHGPIVGRERIHDNFAEVRYPLGDDIDIIEEPSR